MTDLRAVVFDMDGILIDSETIWKEVREHFAAEHGLVWTEADQRSVMGCSTADWSRRMVERLDLKNRLGMDEDAIATEIIGRLLARYRDHLPERPGAIDAVRRMAERWPVALATGSPELLARFVCEVTGLDQHFQAMVFGDDVAEGKPAPDIYLAALAKLEVDPTHAIGIEDSANGLRSLRAAGMGVLAAPGIEFPLTDDVLALADLRIDHMDELTADAAQETLARLRARGATAG